MARSAQRIPIFLSIALLIGPAAEGGWFGPSPSELVLNETVTPQTGRSFEILVDFRERSTYELSLMLEPAIDFHSPEAQEINWAESFEFSVTISTKDGNVLQ